MISAGSGGRSARGNAERHSRRKDDLIAVLSHELRTPLTGIMGMLELLDAQSLGADAHRFVSKARVSSNLLLNLINDILDMSRIEAGKMERLLAQGEAMLHGLQMRTSARARGPGRRCGGGGGEMQAARPGRV